MRADHGESQWENTHQVALRLTLIVGDVFLDSHGQEWPEIAVVDVGAFRAILAEDGQLAVVTTIDGDLASVLTQVAVSSNRTGLLDAELHRERRVTQRGVRDLSEQLRL